MTKFINDLPYLSVCEHQQLGLITKTLKTGIYRYLIFGKVIRIDFFLGGGGGITSLRYSNPPKKRCIEMYTMKKIVNVAAC